MKAIAVFPKEKKVIMIDHPVPEIRTKTEVKLKVLEVGICGTDREICEFKYGTPPKDCDYLILGHEMLGEVVETGAEVSGLQVGDLAVMMVRRPCHHPSCLSCQSNAQDFCYTGDFTERGINGRHGFMTEYVVDDEKYMLRVSQQLRDIAVLTEPLTIAEKAMREIYFIQKRLPWDLNARQHEALVIGAGPVGLLAAHVFIENKFNVSVYSLESADDFRATITHALGAQYISAKTSDIDALKKQLSDNIDVIFDGSGASKLAFELVDLLGYNGVFAWTGIPGRKENIDFSAGTMMRNIVLKNQNIVGSVNAGHIDFENAIHHLSALHHHIDNLSQPLIERYPPESYADLLLAPIKKNVFKNVFDFAKKGK